MNEHRPRVLISLYDEEQEYQRLQVSEGRAAAERVGFEPAFIFCHGSTATQKRQLEAALSAPEYARPVAMVVQPYAAAGLESVAREALRGGIGWVLLGPSFYLEQLQHDFPAALLAITSTDHREMGRLQAKILRALLPRGGSVVLVEGPSLSPAVGLRREGLREGLAGAPIEVVKTLSADWSEEGARRAAAFWFGLGERAARPDLIAAQNDSMALGVRAAIAALRPEWSNVRYTGCDGLPEGGQQAVRDGRLAATVVQRCTVGSGIGIVAAFRAGRPWERSTSLAPSTFPALSEL